MKICANCFRDEEIKNFIISSSSEITKCDFCNEEDCVIEIEELYDFFVEFSELFCIDENATINLTEILNNHWNIFSSNDSAKKILTHLYNKWVIKYSPDERIGYIDEISECKTIWNKLKEEVSSKSRFFIDISSFPWESFIQPNFTLKKNTSLYRARILPDECDKLSPKEMGCPPPEKTPAGRANPLGIPYLYLCDNKETTLYETRSVYLDRVCIGTFRTIRDLKLVNFNNLINPFYAFTASDGNTTLIEAVKTHIIMEDISKDLSKPLRRFDTELEYVPTQFICEYCKLNEADGIMFTSSLHPNGKNVVLFSPTDAKCTKVDCVEVNGVSITSFKI